MDSFYRTLWSIITIKCLVPLMLQPLTMVSEVSFHLIVDVGLPLGWCSDEYNCSHQRFALWYHTMCRQRWQSTSLCGESHPMILILAHKPHHWRYDGFWSNDRYICHTSRSNWARPFVNYQQEVQKYPIWLLSSTHRLCSETTRLRKNTVWRQAFESFWSYSTK